MPYVLSLAFHTKWLQWNLYDILYSTRKIVFLSSISWLHYMFSTRQPSLCKIQQHSFFSQDNIFCSVFISLYHSSLSLSLPFALDFLFFHEIALFSNFYCWTATNVCWVLLFRRNCLTTCPCASYLVYWATQTWIFKQIQNEWKKYSFVRSFGLENCALHTQKANEFIFTPIFNGSNEVIQSLYLTIFSSESLIEVEQFDLNVIRNRLSTYAK